MTDKWEVIALPQGDEVRKNGKWVSSSQLEEVLNYHDRLVEALRDVVDCGQRYKLTKDDLCIDNALELLTELQLDTKKESE